MKYVGIDYGTRVLGTAISDAEGKIAFPREEIPNDGAAIQKIVELARKEEAAGVVLGDTRAITGAENAITQRAEDFANALRSAGLRVERIWEAFSSVEAARFAPKGKTHDNSAAAAIILQRFLDSGTKH